MKNHELRILPYKQYFDLFFEKLNVNQCIALYKKGYKNIVVLEPDKTELYIPDKLSNADIFTMYENGCLFGLDKDELNTYRFVFEKYDEEKKRVIDKIIFIVSSFNELAAIDMLNNENGIHSLLIESDTSDIFKYMRSLDFTEWALYDTSKLKLVSVGTL